MLNGPADCTCDWAGTGRAWPEAVKRGLRRIAVEQVCQSGEARPEGEGKLRVSEWSSPPALSHWCFPRGERGGLQPERGWNAACSPFGAGALCYPVALFAHPASLTPVAVAARARLPAYAPAFPHPRRRDAALAFAAVALSAGRLAGNAHAAVAAGRGAGPAAPGGRSGAARHGGQRGSSPARTAARAHAHAWPGAAGRPTPGGRVGGAAGPAFACHRAALGRASPAPHPGAAGTTTDRRRLRRMASDSSGFGKAHQRQSSSISRDPELLLLALLRTRGAAKQSCTRLLELTLTTRPQSV